LTEGARPIVKIRGLKTAEALEATIAAGADMAGFVFFGEEPAPSRLRRGAPGNRGRQDSQSRAERGRRRRRVCRDDGVTTRFVQDRTLS
jgi:hypothetical protein